MPTLNFSLESQLGMIVGHNLRVMPKSALYLTRIRDPLRSNRTRF